MRLIKRKVHSASTAPASKSAAPTSIHRGTALAPPGAAPASWPTFPLAGPLELVLAGPLAVVVTALSVSSGAGGEQLVEIRGPAPGHSQRDVEGRTLLVCGQREGLLRIRLRDVLRHAHGDNVLQPAREDSKAVHEALCNNGIP